MVGVLSPVYQMMIGARPWYVPWPNLSMIGLCLFAAIVQRRWLHTLVVLYLLYAGASDWMREVIKG